MKIRLAAPITVDSIVDGPGLRTTIWTQGCRHKCPYCHNPKTNDFHGGYEASVESIVEEINNTKLQQGVTLSGGDPLEQVEACVEILKRIKYKDIWCYTGYTFEEVFADEKKRKILPYLTVLVDGKFIYDKRNIDLSFKGSSNQRLIDVKASLEEKNIVLWKEG